MALKLANQATSALATNINASATTITIKSGDEAKFPDLAAGDWFPLVLVDNANNMEIVHCTARSGVTMTVQRGREGTTGRAFSADARVDLRLTTAALDEFAAKDDVLALDGANIGDHADNLRGALGATEIGDALFTAVSAGDTHELLEVVAYAPQALSASQKGQALANIGAGVLAGLRNKIINGDFVVNQRGGTRTPGIGVYGFDRWKGHANGLEQIIEALPAGTYTLTWSGGGTGTFGGVTAASPFVATTAGGNVSVRVPSNATRVSLVPGDATAEADPFSPRHIQQELAFCQRYYQRLAISIIASVDSAGGIRMYGVNFPVPMRSIPAFVVVATGGGSNLAGWSVDEVTAASARVGAVSAGVGTLNAFGRVYGMDAEL